MNLFFCAVYIGVVISFRVVDSGQYDVVRQTELKEYNQQTPSSLWFICATKVAYACESMKSLHITRYGRVELTNAILSRKKGGNRIWLDEVAPNPVSDIAKIGVYIESGVDLCSVDIALYSLEGLLVKKCKACALDIESNKIGAEWSYLILPTNDVISGVYLVTLSHTGQEPQAKKVCVQH